MKNSLQDKVGLRSVRVEEKREKRNGLSCYLTKALQTEFHTDTHPP